MPKLPTALLTPNQVLKCGDYLTSGNGNYYAAVLPDGQFCIYAGDSPGTCRGLSWSSNAVGQLKNGSYALIMQSDGNLCVYESYSDAGHGALIWQSQTAGGTSFAAMQDDGNFCIYRGDGQTNTGFQWGTIQHGGKTSSFGPLQPSFPDIIGDFKARVWNGWYDPTTDHDSWEYFKAMFLTNAAVASSTNPAGIIKACKDFSNADHGNPDRGMWDTMGGKMKGFVSKWTSRAVPDQLKDFSADFLECFKIDNRAAHNADLWSHVAQAANQTKETYVPTKVGGDGIMAVRLHNLGGFNTSFSVLWPGGESEESKKVDGNYGTVIIKLTPQMLTPGTSCWVRAHIDGGPNHDSQRNFDYCPGSFVEYTIKGTTLNSYFD